MEKILGIQQSSDGNVVIVTHSNRRYPLLNNQLAIQGSDITATAYTLNKKDAEPGIFRRCDNASDQTITIPLDTFATGDIITLWREGAGAVEIVGATGVTIKGVNSGGQYLINAQYSFISIRAESASTFIIFGNLTSA